MAHRRKIEDTMFADSMPVTLRLTIVKGGRAGVRCPRGLSGENQKVLKYLRTFLAMNRIVFVRPRRGSSRSTLLGNSQPADSKLVKDLGTLYIWHYSIYTVAYLAVKLSNLFTFSIASFAVAVR